MLHDGKPFMATISATDVRGLHNYLGLEQDKVEVFYFDDAPNNHGAINPDTRVGWMQMPTETFW